MKTTSYIISKQLAEAGFKREHDFSWYKNESGKKLLNHSRCGTVTFQNSEKKILDYYEYCFPAYDLETILDALPNFIANKNKGENCLVIDVAFGEIHYEGDSDNETMFITTTEENESLADTAAKMWLKLKKEGLV